MPRRLDKRRSGWKDLEELPLKISQAAELLREESTAIGGIQARLLIGHDDRRQCLAL
jgi:hypothetical protein